IVNQRDAKKANLLVGEHAARLVDHNFNTEGLGTDGVVIKTISNNLILAGGEPRGTLYAVYTFLEEQVGCHWWTAQASTIPHKPTLDVGTLDVRYVPPFEYRHVSFDIAADPDWSVRNQCIGEIHGIQNRD